MGGGEFRSTSTHVGLFWNESRQICEEGQQRKSWHGWRLRRGAANEAGGLSFHGHCRWNERNGERMAQQRNITPARKSRRKRLEGHELRHVARRNLRDKKAGSCALGGA